MNNLKNKIIEINEKIETSLISIKFEQKEKNTFLKTISNYLDIILIIEITDRKTRNTLFINPLVGIIDYDVEKIYENLIPKIRTSNEIVTTATTSLGYLMPENTYQTWEIPLDFNNHRTQKVIDDIIKSIQKYALPFLESLVDRLELIDALQNNRIGFQKMNYLKIPILYYLIGLKDKGLEYSKNILLNEKPTPKILMAIEPEFSIYKEALDFFKQDKDVLYYWTYKEFLNRYVKYD